MLVEYHGIKGKQSFPLNIIGIVVKKPRPPGACCVLTTLWVVSCIGQWLHLSSCIAEHHWL